MTKYKKNVKRLFQTIHHLNCLFDYKLNHLENDINTNWERKVNILVTTFIEKVATEHHMLNVDGKKQLKHNL